MADVLPPRYYVFNCQDKTSKEVVDFQDVIHPMTHIELDKLYSKTLEACKKIAAEHGKPCILPILIQIPSSSSSSFSSSLSSSSTSSAAATTAPSKHQQKLLERKKNKLKGEDGNIKGEKKKRGRPSKKSKLLDPPSSSSSSSSSSSASSAATQTVAAAAAAAVAVAKAAAAASKARMTVGDKTRPAWIPPMSPGPAPGDLVDLVANLPADFGIFPPQPPPPTAPAKQQQATQPPPPIAVFPPGMKRPMVPPIKFPYSHFKAAST